MGKTFETKNNILGILSVSPRTLTELSLMLGLSGATINQHLRELQEMGAISLIEDQHIRKWKYYRVVHSSMVRARL